MIKYIIRFDDGFYFSGVSDGHVGGKPTRFVGKISSEKGAMTFNNEAMANLVNESIKGEVVQYVEVKEVEQKYIIVDKEGNHLLSKVQSVMGIRKDMIGKIIPSYKMEVGMKATYLLTEGEIKNYDMRYWDFAEKVKY